ncbi:MAG: DUF397 domain-containing protein, partial [Pseudonocardiaceae bacterium]
MMRDDRAPVIWAKSSYSNTEGACVEVTDLLPGGGRGVRDSKDPDTTALWFTGPQWSAFT